MPSVGAVEQELRGRTAGPGPACAPNGRPPAASVSGTGPDHRIEPSTVERISRSGAGPKPFWWNV